MIARQSALQLLREHNREAYHIRHALTVEKVMRWFALDQGYGDEADFWGLVGLLHDIDFEEHPDEHCLWAPRLLEGIDAPARLIRAVCSHGYGMTASQVAPEHPMEKVLFACDELTGLIFAATLMRPSRSTRDMELKSLKKKYKDRAFAAGCSREVIAQGAALLGWPLDDLMDKTLRAMQEGEAEVEGELAALTGDASP
ncbi:MAG: hydrolase [Christensenellales bacterium]